MISIKKFYQITFLLIAFSCQISQASNRDYPEEEGLELALEKTLTLGQRSLQVQQAVDNAFNYIKTNESWELYTGKNGFYGLMQIQETDLLKKLAFDDNDKTEVYLLDVGCAAGGWGNAAVEFLKKECAKSQKHFYIFSVTGGLEQEENEVHEECNDMEITHYRLNQFKIENIDEEFLKRGFNLQRKFDLIVSRVAINHMVDPLGTVSRLYDLLAPGYGMLLTTGFGFYFERNDATYEPNDIQGLDSLAPFFAKSSAIALFYLGGFGPNHHQDSHHLLLLRPDDKPLNLPLAYSEESTCHNGAIVSASKRTTIYKKSPHVEPQALNYFTLTRIFDGCDGPCHINFTIYNQNGDTRSTALLEKLAEQQLFVNQGYWKNGVVKILGKTDSKEQASWNEMVLGKPLYEKRLQEE